MEEVYVYVILPLLIFVARVIDVSLGTIRVIFIYKGFKFLSFIIGFFEVLIWLVAIKQVWSNFTNIWLYIAYAGGFATGNYVGIWLDEKISLGNAMVRIITKKNYKKLINKLKNNNYHTTVVNGRTGREGTDVKIIFVVVRRKELRNILPIINKINPHAFFTIEDIRSAKKDRYLAVRKKRRTIRKAK